MAGIGVIGNGISADCFPEGASLHLLSHFHSDHLTGLKRSGAPIVCSSLTARLLTGMELAEPARLHPLDPGGSIEIEPGAMPLFQSERPVRITAFEANHCPGAVMFLIEEGGRRVVVTGDFRIDDGVRRIAPQLAGADVLYLDATYRGTGAHFPPQDDAIAEVVEICRTAEAGVALGVYTIGKNRVLRAAWEVLGRPFYAPPGRYKIFEILGDAPGCITDERDTTPHSAYAVGYLERYHKPRGETVIIPTGWATAARRWGRRRWIRYVPYSEHCDEAELDEFLDLTRPKQVVEVK